MLRGICGPWRDEVMWDWRRLHKEELNDLYCSTYRAGDKIEKKEMGWACGLNGRGKGGV